MIRSDAHNSSSVSHDMENLKSIWLKLKARPDVGFLDLPTQEGSWTACAQEALKIQENFQSLIVIGIGGSSLGAESVIRTIAPINKNKVIFIDNYDIDDIRLKTASLNLKDAALFIVSKSGNSLYTLSLADFFIGQLKAISADWKKHIWVCTEFKKSPLYDWAQANSFPILEIPKNVGGRFSVFTAAGLVPIAFSGINLNSLRQGALATIANLDPIYTCCNFFTECFKNGHSNTFFWFYSSMMKGFGPWLVQLWSESLGKPGSGATVPVVCIGTIDQHSMLQQISEGEIKENVIFFRFGSLEDQTHQLSSTEFKDFSYWTDFSLGDIMKAEFQGTRDALASRKIPHLSFSLASQNTQEVGALLMFFETVVALTGTAISIDPFNQPGVELSKNLTKNLLLTRQNKIK